MAETTITDGKGSYPAKVAELFIKCIENGTAPWMKPWVPTMNGLFDHNPVTSGASPTPYRGFNAVYLELTRLDKGFNDYRWCTFKQAVDKGWKIKKGSHGTTISFFTFLKKDLGPKHDKDGKPVYDEQGKPVHNIISRPMFQYYTVFNGDQIEGIPSYVVPEPAPIKFAPIDRAEEIIRNSGAVIKHDQVDRAFYRMSSDEIHLPDKSGFHTAEGYYSTLLHELGHWTGHESRLNRKLGNMFGSSDYAREELRAELASYMVSKELSLPHDPGNHVSYVANWVSILKETPKEILDAAHDSEKITKYVMAFEKSMEKERTISVSKEMQSPEKRTTSSKKKKAVVGLER